MSEGGQQREVTGITIQHLGGGAVLVIFRCGGAPTEIEFDPGAWVSFHDAVVGVGIPGVNQEEDEG